MRKIEAGKILDLNKLIFAKEAEVISMKAINKDNSYLSLFALASGEEITAEAMLGERYYYCFSGKGELDIEGNKKDIKAGEFLRIEKNKNYSLKSIDDFKIIEIGEKISQDSNNKFFKQLEEEKVLDLENCVDYQNGKIISKNLIVKKDIVITVMSFDEGEGLEPHVAPGDALVIVLDGEGEYQVENTKYSLKKGEATVLPANIPHAVNAKQRFKMLLALVK